MDKFVARTNITHLHEKLATERTSQNGKHCCNCLRQKSEICQSKHPT